MKDEAKATVKVDRIVCFIFADPPAKESIRETLSLSIIKNDINLL